MDYYQLVLSFHGWVRWYYNENEKQVKKEITNESYMTFEIANLYPKDVIALVAPICDAYDVHVFLRVAENLDLAEGRLVDDENERVHSF